MTFWKTVGAVVVAEFIMAVPMIFISILIPVTVLTKCTSI